MAETKTSTMPGAKAATGEEAITTVVAKFDERADAERALRALNRILRDEEKMIYQGAVVTRRDDGELRVSDMRDLGLADIIMDTADATLRIGLGGIGLVTGAFMAGLNVAVDMVRYVRNSAEQILNVVGESLSYPERMLLSSYEPGEEITLPATGLAPGESAIVVKADQKTALDLAADLKRSGGELL